MHFKELLKELGVNKNRVIINGMGAGETKGTIIGVHEDYIEFELLEIKKEKKSGVEKQTREVKYIPFSVIYDVSEGEVEKETKAGLSSFADKKEGGK